MDKKYNNLMEHIITARIEGEKQLIKANTILLDKELAIVNRLYWDVGVSEPMLCGMKVKYVNNLAEDFGFNFALINDDTPSELDLLRRENAELKETINKIKELLGNEKI